MRSQAYATYPDDGTVEWATIRRCRWHNGSIVIGEVNKAEMVVILSPVDDTRKAAAQLLLKEPKPIFAHITMFWRLSCPTGMLPLGHVGE